MEIQDTPKKVDKRTLRPKAVLTEEQIEERKVKRRQYSKEYREKNKAKKKIYQDVYNKQLSDEQKNRYNRTIDCPLGCGKKTGLRSLSNHKKTKYCQKHRTVN